jgi:pyruvate/2-oxoglutarate dehydrogenase complex dihydrolipoamide dehydrogenase (E3) component
VSEAELPISHLLQILTLEYDLVIIGATAAARVAAIEAVNLQARVALVLPQLADEQLHPQRDFYPYALARIANTHRIERTRLQQPTSYPWKYAEAAIDRLDRQLSNSVLAAMGVDTIVGMGEFCRRPQLAFNVENRSLRARAYLIATGTISHYPLIPGIQAAGYMVLDRLPSLVDRQIPLRWAIIGSESVGVELAQTLAKLGCRVSLIVETERILPYEDPDLANLIQAQLEADGVEIYLETIVTNVETENRAKLVTLGDETIAVDEIFIALPDRPRLESFNLLGVGVDYTEKGISIDNKLQTSNERIYACGGVCGNVLGGYHSQSLTEYEAKIAVRNALSRRKTKVDYNSYQNLPWAVYTDPPLARVGMTLSTATNSDRGDRIVLQSYLKDSPQAILSGINSGFCQVIVTPTGRILGAEIFGQNAPELIQIFAIAIHNQLKIADLTAVPCLSPSYTEFIYQTAQEWHTYQRQRRQKFTWFDRLCWWK